MGNTQSLEATMLGGVAVPDGSSTIPEGTRVRITVAESPSPTVASIWDRLVSLAHEAEGRPTDLPADLAENHDHYLHGRPKTS